MSDPQQETSSSVSFFLESLLGEDVDSSPLQYLSSVETGLGLASTWTDCWDGGVVESVDVSNELSVGMKRKREQLSDEEFEAPPAGGEVSLLKEHHRQRGKNWEKAEEDILVECKSLQMDWKAVSERLQEHGFVRNHKHCADKWYALRKHYLEVRQWIADHPGMHYWDRSSCSERPRSVPPSFCEKWYQVFDSAEHREGRKLTKLQAALNEYPHLENGGGVMDSHRDLLLPTAKLPRLELKSSESTLAKRAVLDRVELTRLQPNWNMMEDYVKEIQNLRQALTWRFAAEEKERSRNLAIQEKKLELKRQQFDYQLRRDEEKRRTVAQCLHFAVKAS